jgi:hypothetical protein
MAERKTECIMVNLEPTIQEAVVLFVGQEGLSASAYCRRLIIKDLKDRGVLTTEHLAQMAER